MLVKTTPFGSIGIDTDIRWSSSIRGVSIFAQTIASWLLTTTGRNVHDYMSELIDEYFVRHLKLTKEDAFKLHQDYYRTYGLAIEGLVRHHKIDPLEYNVQVDDALPLEDIIYPDPELRKLLEDIDKSKVKMWLFTNAYINHGKRVVKLLDVEDMFEGMTFCDYGAERLICKPHDDSFAKAMKDAGITDHQQCYFVGEFEYRYVQVLS